MNRLYNLIKFTCIFLCPLSIDRLEDANVHDQQTPSMYVRGFFSLVSYVFLISLHGNANPSHRLVFCINDSCLVDFSIFLFFCLFLVIVFKKRSREKFSQYDAIEPTHHYYIKALYRI